MPSTYPTALDTLPTDKTDSTPTPADHATHHNDLADAVNKVEATLGAAPSGGFATVGDRLAAIEGNDFQTFAFRTGSKMVSCGFDLISCAVDTADFRISLSSPRVTFTAMLLTTPQPVEAVGFFLGIAGVFSGTGTNGVSIWKLNLALAQLELQSWSSGDQTIFKGVPGFRRVLCDNVVTQRLLQPGIYFTGMSHGGTSETTNPAVKGINGWNQSMMTLGGSTAFMPVPRLTALTGQNPTPTTINPLPLTSLSWAIDAFPWMCMMIP